MFWKSLALYFRNIEMFLDQEKIPIIKQDLTSIADFLEQDDPIRRLEHELRCEDYVRKLQHSS